MTVPRRHRRNSRHWNPPLSRAKLARREQRKLMDALCAMAITDDDLRAMRFDFEPVTADRDQDSADDSGPFSAGKKV